ncbi:MAG: hypothetical protein N3J91_16120 [Verrucomicrobiae bacterium]|nr:hypothetical protein [Verrucomicrobiae bacterium]
MLLGMLLLSVWHWAAERRREEAARREAAAACERVVDKVERRLSAAALLQEEARAELWRALAASGASDMNAGRVRLALRRLKGQLEGAEEDLRRFAEEVSRLAARKGLRHGVALLFEERQRELEAQSGRLDGAWQELAGLEQQADWLTLRWAQAVEKEGAAARQAQAQQLQELEKAQERVQAEMRRMEDAVRLAQEQAERARREARLEALRSARRAAEQPGRSEPPGTVVQVNTGWGAELMPAPEVMWLAPGWGPPAPWAGMVQQIPLPYYGVPAYFEGGYGYRSRIIGYGVRHPRVVRIGPYLVVN